jgi:hypothetical protein
MSPTAYDKRGRAHARKGDYTNAMADVMKVSELTKGAPRPTWQLSLRLPCSLSSGWSTLALQQCREMRMPLKYLFCTAEIVF